MFLVDGKEKQKKKKSRKKKRERKRNEQKTANQREEAGKGKGKEMKRRMESKGRTPDSYRLSHFVAPLYVAPSTAPGNANPQASRRRKQNER